MLHIADKATFQNSLADLPLVTYQPGETVIVEGSKTDRLLILKKGTVAIVKEDTEIAKVAEPGAVFGELSVLLDQPHTADVHVLETSQFHIANATALHPTATFHRSIRMEGNRMNETHIPPNPSPDLCNKASRGRLPTCRRQQHGNPEGPFFPFANT
jgi:5-deoxy-D-glucuronate isomerase